MSSQAIPYITHEFKSTPDIGWYGSAYLLTACAFQPLFGRIFMLFSVKKAYLIALFLFEIGSLLCGVAPNSITLIIGRAIAGLGSAGILTGSFVVVGAAVPLQSRPIFMAVVGTMCVTPSSSPLPSLAHANVAQVRCWRHDWASSRRCVHRSCGMSSRCRWSDVEEQYADKKAKTWRWCFYVNLPVGAATVLAMLLFFHPGKNKNSHRGLVERILDLDIAGNVLLLGAAIMFFLALEYTTQGVSWASAPVIGLLVASGVVAILFIGWQHVKGNAALMPPRIVTQRTVAASCAMAFMIYAALINLTYFLPVWFQAIRGVSALQSGIDMIPYFVVNAVFSLAAGVFVSKVGYATPPAVLGSAVGTVGLGLMTLLRVDTTTAQWVGYQVLTSIGFGISIQQGFTAVQTVLCDEDIAIATAAVVASQSLGGAVFLSVGNSVFQNQLLKASAAQALGDIDIKKLIDSGAASFRHLVPADHLPAMLEIYNKALVTVITVSIPLGVLSAISACFIEWKSVRAVEVDDQEKGNTEAAREGAETGTETTEAEQGKDAVPPREQVRFSGTFPGAL